MKPLLTILFFCIVFTSKAQNLVPNYSFEQYTQCPDNENEVSYSTGWKSYYASPDYYNVCATNPWVSIPYNIGSSYQPAATGAAYCGFYAYWSPISGNGYINLREHIGRQLASPMQIGTKYYVSFKVSLAYNGWSADCATNNIGMKFSSVPYDIYADSAGSSPLVNNFAHIYDTTLISDTVNWTTISGSFVADSTYNYLIIANFFKDANTDTVLLNFPSQTYCFAYYYVDDIYVSTQPLSNIIENDFENAVSIYPNPFSNSTTLKFNDDFHFNSCKVTLYDILGKEIKNYEMKSNELNIERDGLPEGIYFLKIQYNNNFLNHKLLITN